MAPATPALFGFYDECVKGEMQYSLGFVNPAQLCPSGTLSRSERQDRAALSASPIPHSKIGYAYVPNRMGTSLTGDPRDLALRNKIYSIIESLEEYPRLPDQSAIIPV